MTPRTIERLVCVVPPRLTSDAHRVVVDAAGCALGAAASLHASEITLDLSRVETTDAAGLGLLGMTHRRAAAAGVRLLLAGAPPHLRELLAVAGLDRLFSYARAA